MENNSNNNNNKEGKPSGGFNTFWIYGIIVLVLLGLQIYRTLKRSKYPGIAWSK